MALLIYVLMQYGRTAYMADATDEMNDKLIKHIYGPKAKAEGIDLSGIKIGIQDPARYSLSIITSMHHMLLDLNCKLLFNTTDIEFVTSDNPVVLYNQLLSFRKFGSNTGLASKGLQIFFPISPDKVLLFYDDGAYSVGNRSKPVVNISVARDVFEINTLQMCSAYENIYFRDKDFNIKALHCRATRYRRQQMTTMDVFTIEETEEGSREFIHSSREDVFSNLTLSFIRVTKSAKRWRDKFRNLDDQKWTPPVGQ